LKDDYFTGNAIFSKKGNKIIKENERNDDEKRYFVAGGSGGYSSVHCLRLELLGEYEEHGQGLEDLDDYGTKLRV
jgi:hypothetical protein